MEKKKNIDDLLKERLGDYAETPPPAVWDALEKKLGSVPPPGSVLLYKWSPYFIIMSALVVLGILVAGKMQGVPGIAASALKTADNTTGVTNKTTTTIAKNGNNIESSTAINNSTSTDNNNESNNTNSPHEQPIVSDNNISTNKGTIPASNKSNIAATVKTNKLPGKYVAANGRETSPSKTGPGNTSAKQHNSRDNTNRISSSKKRPHAGKNKKQGINSFAANTESTANDPTPANDYGSSMGKVTGNLPAPITNEEAQLPATAKEPTPDPLKKPIDNPVINKPDPKKAAAKKLKKFEAGIKAGYEGGFSSSTGKKTVLSPYVSYKLSSKLSLMLQPAMKYAHVNNKSLTGTQSFYKENNDSSHSLTHTPIYNPEDPQDTLYKYNIVYSQTHDSVVKSYSTGGAYMEFELPVLIKYSISKKFSVYGGASLNYSKYINISEHTYTSAPIVKTTVAPISGVFQSTPTNITYSPFSSEITYPGISITDYKGPLYPTPSGSLLRAGYMLGFNYEYSNRWLFDALMQQAAARPSVTGGYNTNSPFSAPYFRITLGYKIF